MNSCIVFEKLMNGGIQMKNEEWGIQMKNEK
jgi:hypothetical protein